MGCVRVAESGGFPEGMCIGEYEGEVARRDATMEEASRPQGRCAREGARASLHARESTQVGSSGMWWIGAVRRRDP